MHLQEACVECILNQAKRVCDTIHADEKLRHAIVSQAEMMSRDFSFNQNPPQNAAPLYQEMARLAHKKDLYKELKEQSTQAAMAFVPELKKELQNAKNRLLSATKVAVAGNVIDLAAAVRFDLATELAKLFHTDFQINDFALLQEQLPHIKTIMYLADNAGEHVFDYLYIQELLHLYPHLQITYVTRGEPIINDVTYEEAKAFGFERLCTLLNSGVDTPGFEYARANSESKKLFDTADMIIAKGMGNYECLSPYPRKNICFLFKIKCQVVANSIHSDVGGIVCKIT